MKKVVEPVRVQQNQAFIPPLRDDKNKPFYYSFMLHFLLVISIIVAALYHPQTFLFGTAVRSPQQVQIVNAVLVLPNPSLSKVITPTPPAPAAKPTPPTPKPTPVPTPKPKPTPQKTVAKPTPKTVALDKTAPIQQKPQKQTKQQQKKPSSAQQQQALQKLKALGLASINQAVNSNQKEAASAAQAAQMLSIEEKYMGLIQQTVKNNWINQFNPNAQLNATLKIKLDKSGNVLSVSVAQSSGNSAFDRQAVLAVQKSSPLPIPADPDLAKKFMNLTLPFNNQDL